MKTTALIVLQILLAATLGACAALPAAATASSSPTPRVRPPDRHAARLRHPAPAPTSTPVTVCTVQAYALTVRTGPGVEYPPSGWLHAGEHITTTTATTATWRQISTPALTGWVNSHYLECAK